MSMCPGKRASQKCSGQLYRCNNCGSVGCDKDGCTNNSFAKTGKYGGTS